jgi:hypothetical protein
VILVDKQEEIADSLLSLCVRYFLHGIAFSLLFFVLVFFGVFLTFFLVTIGSWLGLIIGIVFILFLIGALNVGLTEIIWGTMVGTGPIRLLAHGVLLLILLGLAGLPSSLVRNISPDLPTTIIMFVIYCFIDGFIARKVALIFEESDGDSPRWSGD